MMSVKENYLDGCSQVKKEFVEVYSFSWTPEDSVAEFNSIFEDCSAADVEQKLINYVADHIEPVGWKAIWRSFNREVDSRDNSSEECNMDFLVNVTHVSNEKLVANVEVCQVVRSNAGRNLGELSKFVGLQMTVPLIELHPTVDQEYDLVDAKSTAEIIELVRFFYEQVWLPWDSHEEVCRYNRHLLLERRKLFDDKLSGAVSSSVSLKLDGLKREARSVVGKIDSLEKMFNGREEAEVDQTEFVLLGDLNKKLDVLKEQYEALCDPMKRELLGHQDAFQVQQLMIKYLPRSPEASCVVFVCCSPSVDLLHFAEDTAKLPRVLSGLGQETSSSVVTFPSVQLALDMAKEGDVVALLSGVHILERIGALARGGVVCGVDENVVIRGSSFSGDVIFDLDVADGQQFKLVSVTVEPMEGQAAIYIHSGRLNVDRCSIRGGSIGVSLFRDSECHLDDASIAHCRAHGVRCGGQSSLFAEKVEVRSCTTGLSFDENCLKISLKDFTMIDCCKDAVILTTNRARTEREVVEKTSEKFDFDKRFLATSRLSTAFVDD